MKVFTIGGLILAVAYIAIIDRVLDKTEFYKDYKSPFQAGASIGQLDVKVTALQSAPIIVAAFALVYVTPKIF